MTVHQLYSNCATATQQLCQTEHGTSGAAAIKRTHIRCSDHQAQQPSGAATIKRADHQAQRPSSSAATIRRSDHQAQRPSSAPTIRRSDHQARQRPSGAATIRRRDHRAPPLPLLPPPFSLLSRLKRSRPSGCGQLPSQQQNDHAMHGRSRPLARSTLRRAIQRII